MDNLLKQKLIDAGYKGEFDLSSLVEACGEKFSGLLKIQESNRWFRAVAPGGFLEVDGSTPEEAVANLYLALQHEKA